METRTKAGYKERTKRLRERISYTL